MRVGIWGASGYAGQDLVEILSHHPHVEIVYGTSNSYAGQPIAFTNLDYIPSDAAIFEGIDVVFLALPHGVSAQTAAKALQAGCRVIDLSADFRLDTPERYQKWYNHAHPHPELLPSPYGLPEFNRHQLTTDVRLVAAPGCYPTTTLLGLYPLLRIEALVAGRPIIVDAKSGVSGAGREPKPNLQFVEVANNFAPYNPGRVHRHVGEIEQEIAKIAPQAGMLIFTPHLLPVERGLMASIYVELNDTFTSDSVQALYEEVYSHEPLVKVLPLGQQASLKHVIRTNGCAISITAVSDKYVHITSVTDNLRKGASGQAVQCFNLICGLEETMALL
ncbi:MAG: N-acetyl-gamma-glutamyl-phosphate reductase [Chitinophagaceae bacterium]|nr:N-acetyl-gamma-glutamyl-phosphate reductase [Anaerolineae bacterium]